MFFNQNRFSESEKRMKRNEFLKGITYLTKEDIEKNKTTIEKLKRLSPMLNEYNALTHSIYLNANPDMPEDEKRFHQQCVATLMENERKQVEEALKVFNAHPHDNHDN